MKSNEIKEKLAKAQEVVIKKQNLLKKYEAKAEKMREQIRSNGWDENNRYCMEGTEQDHDAYWMICDYDHLIDDIKRTAKAIEEKAEIVKKWEARLVNAKEAEERYANEYPEILKEYKKNLVDTWDQQDANKKEFYKKQYAELGYKAFIKEFKYSAYEMMHTSKEDSHKENEKIADALILNLWNRVKDRTGDVTNWNLYLGNGNSWEGIAINGTVKGTKGTAVVESILAGGYNIQRLHVRVLVK